MQRPTQTDEMQRELHATLSAMREVGPAYEDHLVESFVQKFSQQLVVQMQHQAPPKDRPSAGQRLALAIVSVAILLVMSIPIVAIIARNGTYTEIVATFMILCLLSFAVVGINFIFNRSH